MPTPKEQVHNLMVEMFMMIEELNIPEGQYLQFADMFKSMNININRLSEIKTTLTTNRYYINYIRNSATRRNIQRLTEDQKRIKINYELCNCGRYIAKNYLLKHYMSQVHYQGLRNRKYAHKKGSPEQINQHISREVALQSFIIRHITKIETNDI